MTNAERILAAVRDKPGLSDADLCRVTGVAPHQQVNQICRRLEAQGVIRRVPGVNGRIMNILATEPVPQNPTTDSNQSRQTTSPGAGQAASGDLAATPVADTPVGPHTLVVLPCSGDKEPGGVLITAGRSIVDLLPPRLREQLRAARASVAAAAEVDEAMLMPATRRYTGTLYDGVGSRLHDAIAAGVPFVIISGGYGLVLPRERIGMYNRRFSLRDWPPGLLEECLATVARALAIEHMIAFCARTTSYSTLVRRVRWRAHGVEAVLATPHMVGRRGGGQVLVPRASGKALRAFLDGQLTSPWVAEDGIVVELERLP